FFGAFAGGLLYDSLAAVDANNNPIPALATRWSSTPDARKWVFKLRKGVHFHDGRPFTSADAVFSIRRLLDPALGSPATAQFEPLLDAKGIRAKGPYVVEFDLKAPSAFMPNMLATFYPRMVPDGTTPAEAAKGIGTGPFRLVSFQPGVQM